MCINKYKYISVIIKRALPYYFEFGNEAVQEDGCKNWKKVSASMKNISYISQNISTTSQYHVI